MIDVLREHCLVKKEVSESFPFDENTLVFKVYDKMFALISLEREPLQMNLKCEPEKAIELREEYYQVIPGYHSNKKHWNTIVLENISIEFVKKWIDHSYDLVWQKLPKKLKQ
jgi:predicted DNA-binding protein (MmcQ/YjbR family)|tara:strand:+ start:7313 stop:7648 length:336 start_codon:yes stop_codon:yes gene_type:complete